MLIGMIDVPEQCNGKIQVHRLAIPLGDAGLGMDLTVFE